MSVSTPVDLERHNTARLVLAITLLLVFIMAARSPVDSDLWWHLRAGEDTLTRGAPVLEDGYSFTRFGAGWTNHSWLGQVVLASLYRLGGFLALGGMVSLAAVGMMALVYQQTPGASLLRAFAVIFSATVASVVWTARPQLFSLLLFALTGRLLACYRGGGRRVLWLFPPLFILWSNLHGGYPLGLMLMGCVLVGEGIHRLAAHGGEPVMEWREMGLLAGTALVSFLVTAVNPNGVQMWLIPFQTVNVGVLQSLIQEWASPDFHDAVQQPMLWLFLLTVAAQVLSGRKASAVDWVTFIFFAFLALVARRNFGPFALVAAPVFAKAAQGMFETGKASLAERTAGLRIASWWRNANSPTRQPSNPLRKAINLTIVALLGLVGAVKLFSVTQPQMVAAQLDRDYPHGAVAWLKANHPDGRLFNAYNWGGYLIWALPEYPVFVDGRTDLFGDEILGEWIQVVQAQEGWQEVLDRWQVNLILLEPDRPLVRLLPLVGWEPLLQETGYVLYGR